MSERRSAWLRPLAVVATAALVAGCVLPGRSGSSGRPTGNIVLTTRGAEATLRGGPTSVAGSVEEVFRVMEIDLIRQSVDEEGGRIEGQAGTESVDVEMSATDDGRTRIEVRVRRPQGNRWDRPAARGILGEVLRWQAS